MLLKVRSPFAGKPATRQVADHNGAPAFDVQPRVLTPVRAMAASWLTGLGVVAGLGYGLVDVASAPNPDSGMLTAAIAVPLVGGFVLYGALRSLLRKRVRLMLTLEQFSVKTMFGWKHYDRLLPHRFALLAARLDAGGAGAAGVSGGAGANAGQTRPPGALVRQVIPPLLRLPRPAQ